MRTSKILHICVAVTGVLVLASCGTEPMQGTETGNGTSGMVVGLSGKPVRGACVMLVPVNYNEIEPPGGSDTVLTAQTDSLGKYCFVKVLPGLYNLFCDSGANAVYLDSLSLRGRPGDSITTVSLRKSGSIAGTALYSSGMSIESADVVLLGSLFYAPVNSTNGSFFLPNLAPGTYLAKLVTSSAGYFDIQVAVNVAEGRSDTLQDPFLLISNAVTSLACDSSGVWIGTVNGLAKLRNGAWRTFGLQDGLSSSMINCLTVDKSQTAWAGTSLGVARIRNDSLTENFLSQSLPDLMDITALATDSAEGLWIGTPQELFKYNQAGVVLVSSCDQLSGTGLVHNELTAVTAVLCLQPEIFVGTMHGAYWRDSNNVWNAIDSLGDYAVSSMACADGDTVWIGTNQGLRLWSRTGKTLFAPADSAQVGAVTCLTAAGADSVYVGAANGLFLYCESRFVKMDIGAGNPIICTLARDPRNVLWVGTNCGIIRIENGIQSTIQ